MRSQVIYLMLFLANMVHGFTSTTSVNNLSALNGIKNRKAIGTHNKLISFKMRSDIDSSDTKTAAKTLDTIKTQRRYMLLYSATASLCILNLVQSVKYPQYNLKVLENVQNKLFKEATPSICYISTEYGSMADKYNLDKDDLPKGVGSGFVWDNKGHIVTNFHVINKVDSAIVTITDKNNNKKEYKAKLTGVDPDNDLAVLKIDMNDGDKLKTIKYNKDVLPAIGQFAFAIGNPFGQDHTLTTGIVSGVNREITAPTGRKITGIIQTDAAINPGNSGGPLLNTDGEIIGINTASMGMGVSAGIGFAIPIQRAVKSITDIIETGFVKRAIMGISYMERNPSILESEKSGIPIIEKGILVLDVPVDSPAAAAGIKGVTRNETTKRIEQVGDIIIAIADKPVNNPNDLNNILKEFKPDDIVKIKYLRNKEEKETTLKLGSYKGTTFTQLENERGDDFVKSEGKEVNIPLKNLEPKIEPKLN
jgi:S1-C subfamily serine protease